MSRKAPANRFSADSRRVSAVVLAGSILLPAFGAAVCGGGAGTMARLFPGVAAGLAGMLVVRGIAFRTWMREAAVGPLWVLDWTLWLLPASAAALREGSEGRGLLCACKLLVGAVALGYFASCWLSLALEHERVMAMSGGAPRAGSRGRFLSICDRMMNFNRLSMAFMAVIVFLMVTQDPVPARTILLAEVGAAVAILLAMAMAVAGGYRRYVRLMFRIGSDALAEVRGGDLQTAIPVVSNDEFGRLAAGINEMIAGLRERDRIRRLFGQYQGRRLAAELLSGPAARAGGETKEVAVMFVDLRDYTALSEKLLPDQVVALLNEYFGQVVRIVARNGGVVDKFIGDAAMAVFGLFEGSRDPCTAAIEAAFQLREELRQLNARLFERGLPSIDHAAGIHFGTVIAGSIGPEERLQYTVIGDCVNVAARLEGLTRTVGSPLLVSEEAWKRASEECQLQLECLGPQRLKGKRESVSVFGVKPPLQVARQAP